MVISGLHGLALIIAAKIPTQRAHYSASRAKAEAVASRGAIGLLIVNTAADEAGQPWARMAGRWNQPARETLVIAADYLETVITLA